MGGTRVGRLITNAIIDLRSSCDRSSEKPQRPPMPHARRSSAPKTTCLNDCRFARDGDCDDGGPNSHFSYCQLGTDCYDCGERSAGHGRMHRHNISRWLCDTCSGSDQESCNQSPVCPKRPKAREQTKFFERALVSYAFFASALHWSELKHRQCGSNLRYFLAHSGSDAFDLHISVIGDSHWPPHSMPPDERALLDQQHISVIRRPNAAVDAHVHAMTLEAVNLTAYTHFVFLNCGTRGPFLLDTCDGPRSSAKSSVRAAPAWLRPFAALLTQKVPLVGPSISCEQSLHVQSHFLAATAQALPYIMGAWSPRAAAQAEAMPGSQRGEQDSKSAVQAFIAGVELGLSTTLLESGFALGSLQEEVPTRGVTHCPFTSSSLNPSLHPSWYALNPFHPNPSSQPQDPFQLIFLKHGGNLHSIAYAMPDSPPASKFATAHAAEAWQTMWTSPVSNHSLGRLMALRSSCRQTLQENGICSGGLASWVSSTQDDLPEHLDVPALTQTSHACEACKDLWHGGCDQDLPWPERHQETLTSADMIVSHCSLSLDRLPSVVESLAQLSNVRIESIFVYSKCSHSVDEQALRARLSSGVQLKVIRLPNLGRNDHTYAHHLSQQHARLHRTDPPSLLLFVKDGTIADFTQVNKDGVPVRVDLPVSIEQMALRALTDGFACGRCPPSGRSIWHSESWFWRFSYDEHKPFHDQNTGQVKQVPFASSTRPLGSWLRSSGAFPAELVDRVRAQWSSLVPVCYGGAFAVRRDRLLRVPAITWPLVAQALERGDNIEEGHYMERSWAALFAPPLQAAQADRLLCSATSMAHHVQEPEFGQLYDCSCSNHCSTLMCSLPLSV